MTGENGNIRAHAQAGNWGTHHSYNPLHNDMKHLKHIVDAMQPEQVEAASGVYGAIANRVESTMRMLHSQAQRLTENWAGEDAKAAMQQMQKAYSAAQEIYQTSDQTSKALSQYADKQISWQHQMDGFAGTVASSDIAHIASPVGGMAANKASHELMQRIQQDTVNANNSFPTGIGADMPTGSRQDYTPNQPSNPGAVGRAPGMPGDAGAGAGGLPDGGTPGQPPGGNGAGHLPGSDQLPGRGGGTDLAGYTPPGGGGLGGLGGGLGAGGAGSLGAGGAIPGLGGGAAGGLGAGVVGGFPGAGVGADGAGAGAAGKAGMGGMGAGHGGHGDEEEERERTTWLAEDEDIWSGDDGAAPPVIG
jgi:uncharacterized protein YukE